MRHGDADPIARTGRLGEWSVVGKYVLFQLPGWLIVGTLAWAARDWVGLPNWAALTALGAWMAKDAALFPFVRVAYESHDDRGHGMIGARARATETLDPHGFVQIGAELWRAELRGEGPVLAGTDVVVKDVEGLTLVVEPEPPPQSD